MRVGKKTPNADNRVSEKSLYSIGYAKQKIKDSPISPYVSGLYLYGSCARNEQSYHSDVDLLLELKDNIEADALRAATQRLLKPLVLSIFMLALRQYHEYVLDAVVVHAAYLEQRAILESDLVLVFGDAV